MLENGIYWDSHVAKHSWMVVVVQNYEMLNEHQWNNYCKSFVIAYYFIHHFTNMEEMARKRNYRCSNVGIEKFKKLFSFEKKYDWNKSKIQNILPSIKTYSYSWR